MFLEMIDLLNILSILNWKMKKIIGKSINSSSEINFEKIPICDFSHFMKWKILWKNSNLKICRFIARKCVAVMNKIFPVYFMIFVLGI